jgi:hypothetical protein
MRNALSGGALGTGLRSRRVTARQRWLLGDRVTSRHFLDITDLHPEFVDGGVGRLLGMAWQDSVEVMSHPGFGHEYTRLMSDDWAGWTDELPLGSYADLR